MHTIGILQIMLLCMGKPNSATWDQDLMEPLEAVENTPSLLFGEVEDAAKAWLQASEEYLIKPVIQDRADVNLGRFYSVDKKSWRKAVESV